MCHADADAFVAFAPRERYSCAARYFTLAFAARIVDAMPAYAAAVDAAATPPLHITLTTAAIKADMHITRRY